MNLIKNIFFITCFGIYVYADVPPVGNFAENVNFTKQKETSLERMYNKSLERNIKGNRILNNKNTSMPGNLTKEEDIFVGVAKVVNEGFVVARTENDPLTEGLEVAEIGDIEGVADEDTFELLNIVPEKGRGFVYQIKPKTAAGKAMLLRYLCDNKTYEKESIIAKQSAQQLLQKDSVLRKDVENYVDTLKKQNWETRLLTIFAQIMSPDFKKNAKEEDIKKIVSEVNEYACLTSKFYDLIKNQHGLINKHVFTSFLNLDASAGFAEFKNIIDLMDKRAKNKGFFDTDNSWQQMRNFLATKKIARDVLVPTMNAFGALDLFLTTTKTFDIGSNNSQYHYWTPIEKSEYVSYKAEEIRHPNLANPIPNDFHFQRTDLIEGASITGMNGSGKSLALRSVLFDALIRQALGFGRSKNCQFTPFGIVSLNANFADTEERSKAQNEINKIGLLIERLKKNPHLKAHVVYDEPFTSSNVAGAAKILATYVRYLHKIPNASFHWVTHYHEIVDVKELTPWGSRVVPQVDGGFEPEFKIKQGGSLESNLLSEMSKKCGPEFVKLYEKHYGKIGSTSDDSKTVKVE